MICLIAISLGILFLYMLKIGIYRQYWELYPVFVPKESAATAGISVVIAFRNEQQNLPELLYSLERQKYPEELWEVILVDDHSSDQSAQLVIKFAAAHPGFHLLQNGPGENGKKAAVIKAIRYASHGLIVTTDADCTMNENWLSAIGEFYSQHHPSIIIGLVDMNDGNGFFSRFQEVEFLSLIAAGAAATAGGRPLYCNAANLSFEKELMISQPDPMSREVPSGDDTLFMLKIKHSRDSRIMLLKSADAVVKTRSTVGLRQFINQRSRWASKSRYYSDRDIIYTACLVVAVSLVMTMSMVMSAAGRYLWLFPLLLAGKSLTDYYFMRCFLRFYKKRPPGMQLIVFEVIYPLYIMVSILAGIFSSYSWKGRKYN
jgi:poly-beta-1,6-N-acetyl-D-glucosamine synthase